MNRLIKLVSIALFAVVLIAPLNSNTAYAQDDQPNQRPRPAVIRTFIVTVLDVVERSTDLTRNDIITQLREGKSLTEVITAAGGNVETIKANAKTALKTKLDEAVKNNTLTQAQADRLVGYIDTSLDQVFSFQFPTREDRLERRFDIRGYMLLVRETTDATDLLPFEMTMQLRDGKTLAQIATENGADVNKIVDAAVTRATEQINRAVENNRMTREEADQLIAGLKEEFTKYMNETPDLRDLFRPGGRRGRPGFGGMGGNNKDGDPAAPTGEGQ